MVPNPQEIHNNFENPIRDAAIHFGAFLQLKGLLSGNDRDCGTIEQKVLLDQFTNHYQPRFRSHLELPELLRTLRNHKITCKNRRQDIDKSQVRVVKHPNPESVREPGSVPRVRFYVDQTRVLRDGLVRTDVVCEGKCRLCNVTLPDDQARLEHVDTDLHKFKLQYREKRSSFKSVVGNSSISIKSADGNDIDSDLILSVGEHNTVKVKVSLEEPNYLTADIFKIMELAEVEATPTNFRNGVPIEINVTAMFTDPGAYIFPLVAKVMPKKLCLLKDLIFRVESQPELIRELAPVSPYVQQENVIKEMMGSLLSGEELPKAAFKLIIKVPLGGHKIPKVYNKLLLHKLQEYEGITPSEKDTLANILGRLCGRKTYKEAMKSISQSNVPFTENLNKDNHSERFALLLDMEQMQQERQIKNYDRSNVQLTQCNTKFLLQVPDLSEGRPSVTRGDKVHVRLQGDDTFTYEGVIHEIREQGLLLGFHKEFNRAYADLRAKAVNPKVDVRFTVNPFPVLNMHRALNLIKQHQAHMIVFPKKQTYNPPMRPTPLKPWNNPDIESNPEQQLAVKNIINRSSGSAPYLVFGPPGTGKTVTLVETIVQVWLATPSDIPKQLVCAPSNDACDNIAKRLIDSLPNAKILRLFSLSTDVDKYLTTADGVSLLNRSNYNVKSRQIWMPTMDEISSHQIIISTLVSSGRMVTGGAQGLFEFVYIDECGQASEPEALIAVAGLLTTKKRPSVGQLVLAGDPQQLGPVLSSQLAKDFGLGMSLLERFMNHMDLYKKAEGSGYDSRYLTKLVQNFRSHPNILKIPNELFYDSELEVKGNPDTIMKAVNWQGLPNKTFPLIFHGVQGIDERESNSPSYFNRSEIDRVIMYIKQLFQTGLPNNYKVKQQDIGVITPYRKQAQKFGKAFEILRLEDIKVGSVETFQGSEKLIIFISTVRSNVALVEEDYRFKLGFLKNPKRFNVSVTRAQALLVVVGNPNILRHDKQWYQLMKYCRDNNATVGVPVPVEDPPEHPPEHVAG